MMCATSVLISMHILTEKLFETERKIVIRFRFRKTKAKKLKEKIKANAKIKEERIQYWKMHCKPAKRMYTIAERRKHWFEHSRRK